MKKYSTLLILMLISSHFLYSKENKLESNIDSILKIKPETNYYENLRYREIKKYQEIKEKEIKSNYDFGFNVDINRQERTIEGIKIDLGIHF